MANLIGTLPWLLMMFFWLAVLIYFFTLFSRFVRAVEKIAEKFDK
jgi:hypothetical protein